MADLVNEDILHEDIRFESLERVKTVIHSLFSPNQVLEQPNTDQQVGGRWDVYKLDAQGEVTKMTLTWRYTKKLQIQGACTNAEKLKLINASCVLTEVHY